jgi:hypothetical protein
MKDGGMNLTKQEISGKKIEKKNKKRFGTMKNISYLCKTKSETSDNVL